MEDRVKARVPAEAAVVGLGVSLDEIDQGAGTLLARKHKLRKQNFQLLLHLCKLAPVPFFLPPSLKHSPLKSVTPDTWPHL